MDKRCRNGNHALDAQSAAAGGQFCSPCASEAIDTIAAALRTLCRQYGYLAVWNGLKHHLKASYQRTPNRDARRDYAKAHDALDRFTRTPRMERFD